MADENMITDEAWDQLEEWYKSEEQRMIRNIAERIASGEVEEPGPGDYEPDTGNSSLFAADDTAETEDTDE